MSDTWKEIQSVRSKTAGLRDKLAKRKQERQNILDASQSLLGTASNTQTNAVDTLSGNASAATRGSDGVTAEPKETLPTFDTQSKPKRDEVDSQTNLSTDDIVSVALLSIVRNVSY